MLLVPGVEVVLVPSTSSPVRVGTDGSQKLITLAELWDRDTAGIQECLEAGVRPSLDSSIESFLSLQLQIVRGASEFISSLGSGSTNGLGGSGGSTSSLGKEMSPVLAGESNQLIALRALGHLHIVLVEELLQLRVRPGIEKLLTQRSFGSFSGGDNRCSDTPGLKTGQVGVSAHISNELVTVRWLRSGPSSLIEPLLQVGVGPLLVQPVARVGGGLASLFCDRFVVLTSGFDEGIAFARLGCRNAVAIEECLQLGVGPATRGLVCHCRTWKKSSYVSKTHSLAWWRSSVTWLAAEPRGFWTLVSQFDLTIFSTSRRSAGVG